MSSIFLSHDEVVELTASRLKAGQIRVLKKNGIRHTIKASGWPCVPRSAVLGIEPDDKKEAPAWTPRKAG